MSESKTAGTDTKSATSKKRLSKKDKNSKVICRSEFNEEFYQSQLSGTYTEDLDILQLHEKVVAFIADAKQFNLRYHREQLTKVSPLLQQKVQQQINEINNTDILGQYNNEVKDILSQFSSLKPYEEIVIFGRKNKTVATVSDSKSNPDKEKRLRLISKYLEISVRYAPVNFHYGKLESVSCSSCGNQDLSGDECKECGAIQGANITSESLNIVSNTRKVDVQTNIVRSISHLNNFNIDDEIVNKYLPMVAPHMVGISLPARYLGFKMKEQDDPKVSPESMGIKASSKTLAKYDSIWEGVVKKAREANADIVYKKSF